MSASVLFDQHGRSMKSSYAMRTLRSETVRHSKRYWYYVSKKRMVLRISERWIGCQQRLWRPS